MNKRNLALIEVWDLLASSESHSSCVLLFLSRRTRRFVSAHTVSSRRQKEVSHFIPRSLFFKILQGSGRIALPDGTFLFHLAERIGKAVGDE